MMFTDFGFKNVESAVKKKLVQGVFKNVASNYDRMNDVMSGGLHRYWKDYFISNLPIEKSGCQVLDLAGGTGDIAFGIVEKFNHLIPQITLCDLTYDMIEVGQNRAINKGILHNLNWTVGNAESTPFEDASFDLVTISFGLRNCTYKEKVLSDALRVLKPGGFFYCLEFSKPISLVLQQAYDCYSFSVIPKMGKLIAQDQESYKYLVESIRKFPDQETLKNMMMDTGFIHASYKNLTGGIVAIHKAQKTKEKETIIVKSSQF